MVWSHKHGTPKLVRFVVEIHKQNPQDLYQRPVSGWFGQGIAWPGEGIWFQAVQSVSRGCYLADHLPGRCLVVPAFGVLWYPWGSLATTLNRPGQFICSHDNMEPQDGVLREHSLLERTFSEHSMPQRILSNKSTY